MSLEREIRELADMLADHRRLHAATLDRETFRLLNDASTQAHHLARRLRNVTMELVSVTVLKAEEESVS